MPALRVEIAPPVAWVVLDRPDDGNPIDDPLIEALCAIWETLDADRRVRAVGLRANGPVFSSGIAHGRLPAGRRFGPKSCNCDLPVLVELAGDIASGAFQLLGEADEVLASTDVCLTAHMNPWARLDVMHLRPRLTEPQLRRLALLGPFEPLTALRAHELGVIDEVFDAPELHVRSVEALCALARRARTH
jgi:enoyl-CoA hydratase/carnithine racemase